MDGFEAETLKRLPLAQAVFCLFSHVLDERHLGDLFERHRGRCYERELSFATVVYLLRDALLVHEGSGNASFTAARQASALPVTVKSTYEKLGRFPLELSLALLRETTVKLLGLLPQGKDRLAASLSGLTVIAFDGKKIKKAAKRLKPLRGLIAEAILWMGDRQFGNLDLPALLTQRDDHFLLRCTKALKLYPDPQRPAQEGIDERGRRWVQRGLFDLQKLIGSTPQAMIFQSAFCFVLYNLVEVIRTYVACGAARATAEVSTEKLFDSVCRQLVAWDELGEPAYATAYFQAALPAEPLKEKLRQLLSNVWTDRWLKACNKKPRPPTAKASVKAGQGGPSSVWRILQAHKQQPARP